MFVELDPSLHPRDIKDINDISQISSKKFQPEYEVKTGKAMDFFLQAQGDKHAGNIETIFNELQEKKWREEFDMWMYEEADRKKEELTKENPMPDLEAVLGTDTEICFDQDWGFFSTILACYNNHWILKTSPDDWWNVIVRNISQAVDDHGDKQKVRDFFVSHEGQKNIHIEVPSLINLDYDWLFDILTVEVRKNIKRPGYVDLMEADFSTTTPDKRISTQIMLMSSVKKYFTFALSTYCGIRGVEMTGTEKDWEQLTEKITELEKTLKPILEFLELTTWFKNTKEILSNLLKTYRKNPDLHWWRHILTWNEINGSGKVSSWNGWIIDFLMAGKAETPLNFRSGVVSLPIVITDTLQGPLVEDTGHLIAGTLGFKIQKGEHCRPPSVEAIQGWALLMPKGSEVTPRLHAVPRRLSSEVQTRQSLGILPSKKVEIEEETVPLKSTAELNPEKSAAELKQEKSAAELQQEEDDYEIRLEQQRMPPELSAVQKFCKVVKSLMGHQDSPQRGMRPMHHQKDRASHEIKSKVEKKNATRCLEKGDHMTGFKKKEESKETNIRQ